MRVKNLIRPVLCILTVCYILICMPAYSYSEKISSTEAQGGWLMLLYDDADFENGYDPIYDFAGEAYAHENLDILVLQDNFWSPAMLWQIGPDHEMIPQKYMGEINMSDETNLEYFLRYADNRYPGRRVILCVYDHGMGWLGSCIDENIIDEGPGFLSLPAMRQALEKTRCVDLICFTAPCSMGCIEAAYELRHNTDSLIGSESGSGYIYWYGTIRFICDTLKNQPDISNIELSQKIVKSTEECSQNYFPDYIGPYTMAAVRSDRMDNAVTTIRELTTAALANSDETFSLFNQAKGSYQSYGYQYADLIDLFEEVKKLSQNTLLRDSFQKAVYAVRQAIIAEAHGSEVPGSNGLNIYFPSPPNASFNSYYGSIGISFADDSRWFEFLQSYHASQPGVTGLEPKLLFPQTNGLFPPINNPNLLMTVPRCDRSLKKRGAK